MTKSERKRAGELVRDVPDRKPSAMRWQLGQLNFSSNIDADTRIIASDARSAFIGFLLPFALPETILVQ
jgi:hypothetical protein